MVIMAILIALLSLVAGVWNIVWFIRNKPEPKRFYVLGKGLAIIYLGTMYGIVSVDYFINIVNYPGPNSMVMTSLLRVAAVSASLIFISDAWIRNKL